jgi:hypothetical protein
MSAAARLTVIAVAAAVSMALLWLTQIPLGIPGEWVWNRIEYMDGATETLLGIAQFGIIGAIYVLLAWQGQRHVDTCSRRELVAWLSGLVLVGFAWLVAVQEGPRDEYRLSKAPFVLYYPASSGYFHAARYDIASVPQLLRTYEQRMEKGDVLHEGTHPPGLYVLYRWLISLVDGTPALVAVSDATMPKSFQDACDTIDYARQLSADPLKPEDRTVMWLASLLTMLCAAAAVVPLFALVLQTESRAVAWKTVAFWPLIPVLAIFTPKSDVLFVFPAALLIMLWMLAVRHQSVVLGALAGLTGWFGLFLSLVFLPIGLVAFIAGMLTAMPAERESARAGLYRALLRIRSPAVAGLVVVMAATALLYQFAEINLARVWWLNWQNHAGFYDQYSRTVSGWLLVNPVELAFAVGAPIACLAVTSVANALRPDRCELRPVVLAVVFVWGLLWLSGKNSGEAARLWIPLLPLLMWVMANGLRGEATRGDIVEPSARSLRESGFIVALVIQMIVSGGTVLRVSGFHFSGITN